MRTLLIWLLLALPCAAQDILGVRIYYSDKVVSIPWETPEKFGKDWQKAPADDVQVVNVYYTRTYDANGQQRHYKDVLEGKDYYFWSPSKGFGTTDRVREIPDDVSTVKVGRLLPDGEWLKLYNKANNDHDF